MDYGWINPSAMIWLAIDYDDNVFAWDEGGGIEKTPAELVAMNQKHGKRIITPCDYSIKRPDSHGRSLWDDLLREGLMLIESNKQEIENIVLVNTMLKNGRLKICRNCVELIKEIKNYKWKRLKLGEEKNHPEQPVDKDNHYIDALLYGVAFIERRRSQDPAVLREQQSLRSMTMRVPEPKWEDRG